ncbi:UdgX family uracil-DNA binding protein [Marivita sp. S6314]|uniref:UdgX family uracil-DNA binding protein n=1 Tax=Marivita sp. S6314 TaxID=2926406 RepID=UPI001FF6A3F4|nr:UdgX family uracil-DNA binding protein [Marivita sp. S6314]MCK0150067.1 UdgX family uracil-DNA binding protein [Marivita sp. S6314]
MPRIGTADAWRDAARSLVSNDVPPEQVQWTTHDAPPSLFGGSTALPAPRPISVPRSFLSMANSVVWHSDPTRFAQLYAFLWRLRQNPQRMQDRADVALASLRRMEKAVHRCQHKMKAFVRFRELPNGSAQRRNFAAWFEPTHHTVEPTAEFFRRRFADMNWLIATPDVTVQYADGQLDFTTGQPRPDLPPDASEELWITYYQNIFNPARLKISAMTSEMPKKYWRNLPEAASIPALIAGAERRATEMALAAPTLPRAHAAPAKAQVDSFASRWSGPVDQFEADLQNCTRCPLHCHATQAVPGEGPEDASVMLVGEQPGDHEDIAGRPFVGPAGQMLDRVMHDVGLDREEMYLTNAVKHFKYKPKGKRRVHQRPNSGEVTQCRWWLNAEIARVQPKLIVALGATAAEALTGNGKAITNRSGRVERHDGVPPVLITVHPSFLLRAPSPAARSEAEDVLRRDLGAVRSMIEAHK